MLVLTMITIFTLIACSEKEKAGKYCWNCGEGLNKDASFCEYCGVETKNIEEKTTTISETSEKDTASNVEENQHEEASDSPITTTSNSEL
ncbi:MAG: zinc ribbon domain-containing protein, partial [Clostridia bacterium]|nr:zinc ribbon domain-containing protein [Clostridia bacterium]